MSPSRNQERDFLNLPTIIDRMFFNSITEFDSYNTFGRGPERTRYRTNAILSWGGLERKTTFSGARISSMQNKHWIFMALLVKWLYDSPPVCNSKIFDERRIMPGQNISENVPVNSVNSQKLCIYDAFSANLH